MSGFRDLLEYCLRRKEAGIPVEGLFFFSTSEIYGDPTPENIPTPETYRGNVSCTASLLRRGKACLRNAVCEFHLTIRLACQDRPPVLTTTGPD